MTLYSFSMNIYFGGLILNNQSNYLMNLRNQYQNPVMNLKLKITRSWNRVYMMEDLRKKCS